jgi:DNA-binding HxlR family transcriptional regulator
MARPGDRTTGLTKQQLPRSGGRVRGSTTGRPLMAAMDLLGRRWALRILWELRHGPVGARALRARCDGMSSSVLYERLKELTDAGLVTKGDEGYLLTEMGSSLGSALQPLSEWALVWSSRS